MSDGDAVGLRNARVEWLEDGTPWSPEFGDVYFSRAGGLEETRHVFLENNDLARRWRERDRQGGVFTVAELGFGTGLNFLACWQLWQQTGCRRLRLHYISCEQYPLNTADLQRALANRPELENFSAPLLESYPDHSPGYHRLLLRSRDGASELTLDLYYGDARQQLAQQSNPEARVDAWFLDGFSPARNPQLWQEALLERIATLSGPGTSLGSYSVTGRVVRKLRSLGFSVEKRPGFGHKRHMLHAEYSPETAVASGAGAVTEEPVVVIGAGLAGACAAWSLARRGRQVTVLEAGNEAACGASGNPQAVLQCRLNRVPDAQWRLNTQAFLHASRFYSWLQEQGQDIDWHACGVLTLDSAYARTRRKPGPGTYDHYPRRLLRRVPAEEASRLCGTALGEGGFFLPAGGWLDPARLCRQLLSRPGIRLQTASRVEHLAHDGDRWQLRDAAGATLASAREVVIANSHAARTFDVTAGYPLIPLRGQVSYLPASEHSGTLQCVVCARSYLIPSRDGRHCVGASYHKNRTDTELSEEDNRQVMDGVLPHIPALSDSAFRARAGRASVRGGSRDFMPLAGPVPDPGAWPGRHGGARHDGPGPQLPQYLPGLYISAGHGSHGLGSCPLSGEHIASLVMGEASPLPANAAALLDPWRFIARRRRSLASA